MTPRQQSWPSSCSTQDGASRRGSTRSRLHSSDLRGRSLFPISPSWLPRGHLLQPMRAPPSELLAPSHCLRRTTPRRELLAGFRGYGRSVPPAGRCRLHPLTEELAVVLAQAGGELTGPICTTIRGWFISYAGGFGGLTDFDSDMVWGRTKTELRRADENTPTDKTYRDHNHRLSY
jgi:hypothetical protein